jgi:hypothetical protein
MIIRSLFILLLITSISIWLAISNRNIADNRIGNWAETHIENSNRKYPKENCREEDEEESGGSLYSYWCESGSEYYSGYGKIKENWFYPVTKKCDVPKIKADDGNIRDVLKRVIKKCKNNNVDLRNIDTTAVTNMQDLFSKGWGRDFNGNISNWNVKNVKNMEHMFRRSAFNGDISEWDVSNVRNMNGMFRGRKGDNTPFNQSISDWELDSLTHAKEMFKHSNFNKDISQWSPKDLVNTKEMFRFSAFDGDLSTWRFPDIKNIEGMFWDSKFDCKTIPTTWLTYPVKNGSFTSCGVSNIEAQLKSTNQSLWVALIALWGLFLLILWPLINKMEKNRKKENKQKNTSLEHLNMSLKQSIGIINMIFSKIRKDEDSKFVTKNTEIIEQTLNKMSVISSRVISSTYCKTRISELFSYAGLGSKIDGNLNEFIKDNKRLELQLKDSALEAIKIVVDSMTSPSDTTNNLKINIKNVRLNNFKNPVNLIFFKEAIEIKISNTGLNNIDAVNQHAEELKLAKEFIELQHYGKFKTNKTGSEVVITLPIKKIEHY